MGLLDLDMNTLANLAEIFSALMIIVSLLFVGMQLRGANRAARAGTFQTVSDTESNFITLATEHADVWDLIITGEIDPAEDRVMTRRAVLLLSSFMIDTENRYRQYREGTLDRVSWKAREGALSNMFRNQVYPIWRASPGASVRSPSFLAVLDRLHAAWVEETAAERASTADADADAAAAQALQLEEGDGVLPPEEHGGVVEERREAGP